MGAATFVFGNIACTKYGPGRAVLGGGESGESESFLCVSKSTVLVAIILLLSLGPYFFFNTSWDHIFHLRQEFCKRQRTPVLICVPEKYLLRTNLKTAKRRNYKQFQISINLALIFTLQFKLLFRITGKKN